MTRQIVYVLGYPKSGTTWLSRLLGDALSSPVGALNPTRNNLTVATEGEGRPGKYYIRQGHATPSHKYPSPVIPNDYSLAYKSLTNERIIVMVRDPRDVAISVRHHWGMDSLMKAVRCMIYAEWPVPHGGGWVHWNQVWCERVDVVGCWTSYEALRKDTLTELGRILGSLDIRKPATLRSVIKRQSFNARKRWTQQHGDDLNYGKEFQLRFLRKGIVGDWRNHDWTNCYDLATDAWGEMMEKLGYEL
jgi:hypothetical protein